jgi:hypothetical protein
VDDEPPAWDSSGPTFEGTRKTQERIGDIIPVPSSSQLITPEFLHSYFFFNAPAPLCLLGLSVPSVTLNTNNESLGPKNISSSSSKVCVSPPSDRFSNAESGARSRFQEILNALKTERAERDTQDAANRKLR